MECNAKPRQFNEWRNNQFDRAEDAAYTFGNHLIKYCRDQVMEELPAETSEKERAKIKAAIHHFRPLLVLSPTNRLPVLPPPTGCLSDFPITLHNA